MDLPRLQRGHELESSANPFRHCHLYAKATYSAQQFYKDFLREEWSQLFESLLMGLCDAKVLGHQNLSSYGFRCKSSCSLYSCGPETAHISAVDGLGSKLAHTNRK